MVRDLSLLACGLIALAFAPAAAGAQPKAPAAGTYIGASKCKACHSKARTGDQWGTWSGAGHAKAFETLASAKAKEVAAKKGIADPQKAAECLQCHVTAYGVDAARLSTALAKKGEARHAEGVGCEACHGPAHAHLKARFAAAADEEEGAPEKARLDLPAGELDAALTVATCKGCHNEKSPTAQPFDCAERTAKIIHSDPRRGRAKADAVAAACKK